MLMREGILQMRTFECQASGPTIIPIIPARSRHLPPMYAPSGWVQGEPSPLNAISFVSFRTFLVEACQCRRRLRQEFGVKLPAPQAWCLAPPAVCPGHATLM